MGAPEGVAPRTSLVERQRLFDRLSAGVPGGLILVSAAAGSGKTIAIRSWLEASGLGARSAWVSVEPDERDGTRFWLAVVEALRAAGLHGPLDDVVATAGLDGRVIVERIVAAVEPLQGVVVLVVDDLHHLLDPTAVAELDLLLARRPPQLCVVIGTRQDPALALHRPRLAGHLTEVRAQDLAFGRDETRLLLAGAGVAMSDAAVESLLARTEGWAAGLRLAARSLTTEPDQERFVAAFSGSDRAVADYLFAEVLAREPDHVRRLLLATSILDRVSGALADRMLGTAGSERILLELEDAGAFVVSLDRERTWFRYHRLFADLLRLELRRTAPETVPGLHLAAAAWFEEQGHHVDAIRQAEAARDFQLAAELIGRYGFTIALDGSFGRVRELLEPLPPEALENPELAALLAYAAVIRPSLDSAASYLAIAERHAAQVPEDRRRAFEGLVATARLTLARWTGDDTSARADAARLLEPIDARRVGDVAVANDVRLVTLMSLGIVELWSGAGDDGERHLREAVELARRTGRPYLEMGSLAHLAVAVGRRSLEEMRTVATETLALMERYGWQSEPVAPIVFGSLAVVPVWRAMFEEAEPWLERAEGALRPNAEPAKELFVRYARGLLLLGRGHLEDAEAMLGEAHALQGSMRAPDPLATQARAIRVQVLARLGRLDEARSVLETAVAGELGHAETSNARAALLLAEDEARTAIDVLAPVLAGSLPVIRDVTVINALLLDASARDRLRDDRGVELAIERALELAEDDALVLSFLITPVTALLERHPRHRTAHAALLGTVLDVLAGVAPPARRASVPALAEPLTDSELRILRYLPSNLSAPEIAGEVYLSTSTVKTHMRHVYEKLDAHTRTEAVARARDLGLLGPSTRPRR
jgi:LuxR family maltose regulon positive regulatory protein